MVPVATADLKDNAILVFIGPSIQQAMTGFLEIAGHSSV
jgi:hypothetical protein